MSFLKILSIVFIFGATSTLHAEESAPAPTAAASSEEGLRKSFQREYVYLVSQKEALSKQKAQMQQSFQKRIGEAKGQTQFLQKELVRLTAQNDEVHEELMNLEKRKKDLQKRGSSLENTYKKAQKSTAEFSSGLHFQAAPNKKDEVPPENLKLADFDGVFENNLATLEASAQVETFPGTFLDPNEKLVEGTLTRIGRNAAIGTVGDTHYVLGPNGEGLLKALEKSKAPQESSLNVYIFDSLSKVARLQKQGGFTEKLADASPLLFLTLMLFLVGGLFTALLRV
jgi:hypothetical protein